MSVDATADDPMNVDEILDDFVDEESEDDDDAVLDVANDMDGILRLLNKSKTRRIPVSRLQMLARLGQHFVVDQMSRNLDSQLFWIRSNQSKFGKTTSENQPIGGEEANLLGDEPNRIYEHNDASDNNAGLQEEGGIHHYERDDDIDNNAGSREEGDEGTFGIVANFQEMR